MSEKPQEAETLIITSQQIRDRIAVIEKVLKSWKGMPDYANTTQMEIWSLTLAAGLLEAAEKIVDDPAMAMAIAAGVAKDG